MHPRTKHASVDAVKPKVDPAPHLIETLDQAGLHYVSSSQPGICRERRGEEFVYVRPDGKRVGDPKVLDRIQRLAIPPAYRKVWICMDPNGHLQATGIDARGRKQYRYHSSFRELRDENKFHRMIDFGRALPRIRAQVRHDLALGGLPKERVLAVVVFLLEKSLIRVGNQEYARENSSYGLTTLQSRHLQIHGADLKFKFKGKSRIWHEIQIHDPRLAQVIKKIQDLPGQALFEYVDEDGKIGLISSTEVNGYLAASAGDHFTAKDFRTWWGTLLALAELTAIESGGTKAGTKRAISNAMKNVAAQLGNTPAVCRKSYVHPLVLTSFEKDLLKKFRTRLADGGEDPQACVESILLKLLGACKKDHA